MTDADTEDREREDAMGMDRWRQYEAVVRASWGSTPGNAMDDPQQRMVHAALALCTEAGEAGELVKKAHRRGIDCFTVDRSKLADELGDVLWAVATLANLTGFTLDDLRRINTSKVWQRHRDLIPQELV